MGKRNLKFGGKSGILPKVRPVFKRNPVRPPTAFELAEEAKIEQGYAEGVPLPQKTGITFHRKPVRPEVITVEERIKRNIEAREPANVDESKLTQDEIWQLKRDEIRRLHLKEAYLTEARRLERIEELKAAQREAAEVTQKTDQQYEESQATKLTMPTIESYLKGPLMRERTAEEKALVHEQRLLNRKTRELETSENNATNLLELYHAAAKFITTEEELELAIHDAFEVDVSKFETNQMVIANKLAGYQQAFANIDSSEALVTNQAYGELNGQPGLPLVKDTVDGVMEKLKREARLAVNDKAV